MQPSGTKLHFPAKSSGKSSNKLPNRNKLPNFSESIAALTTTIGDKTSIHIRELNKDVFAIKIMFIAIVGDHYAVR
jgi:hypothetical protein